MSSREPLLYPRLSARSLYSRSSVLLANISSGLTWRGRIFWSCANWITASMVLRLAARP